MRTVRAVLAWGALVSGCNTAPTPVQDPTPAPSLAPTVPTPVSASATPKTARDLAAATMVKRHHPLDLVQVESSTPAASDSLPLVTLTKTDLFVGDDAVAKVTPGTLGFDATLKRNGNQKALQVTPLEDALAVVRRADPGVSEVRLLVARTTPYRSALEVFFTAAHAGFTTFDFLVAGRSGERTLRLSTPTAADHRASRAGTAPPALAVVVRPAAFTLSVGPVPIGSGCTKGGAGETLSRAGGEADLGALVRCVGQVRSMSPDWADLTTVQLSAANDIDMQAILEVVAALLPALPNVYLGLLQ